MVSFSLGDEQRMLRDLARDFARNEIAPQAAHYDRTAEFPWPLLEQAHRVGLMNLNVPVDYGGAGANVLEQCLVREELTWGCAGITSALVINNLAAMPIILAGTGPQKREFLGRLIDDGQLAAYCVTEPAAGSDVAGMLSTAVRRGDTYVLNGSKTFISNASVADFYVVFAYTDRAQRYDGLSAFLVERRAAGVTVSEHFDKLGQRCADLAEVVFQDVAVAEACRLGREGDGFKLAMRVFDFMRPTVAAGAVGVAQRALDEAVKYARERRAFDKPLGEHQGVGFMLADMAMNVEAARLLSWQAATLADDGTPSPKHAAFAKAFAADMALRATIDALQVHGGYGYLKEFPVEKLLRDVKVYQIYEGTSQIQRLIIARQLLRD